MNRSTVKTIVSLALSTVMAMSVSAKEITPKWRGSVEFKELEKAKATAVKKKQFLTVLVCSSKYDTDSQGARAAVSVIEDTVKNLKRVSVIVRATVADMRGLQAGKPFNDAAIEGFQKAGDTLPMIIVINPATNKLHAVVPPQKVFDDGGKAFREVKKAARDLKK